VSRRADNEPFGQQTSGFG